MPVEADPGSEANRVEPPGEQPVQSGALSWWGPLALLLAVAGLSLGGWQYHLALGQQQAMESLAGRIQELEIRLSETGQDLSETGSSFSQKLAASSEQLKAQDAKLEAQGARLDWAASEIRKLWVVAHQRNRPAIAQIQQELQSGEQRLQEAVRQSEQIASKVEHLSRQLSSEVAALTQEVATTQTAVRGYSSRMTEVSLATSTLSQQLRDQNQSERVGRLESEVQGLQRRLDSGTRERLDEFEEILASLEASRSQLVSRVTRLMDDVRELQQGR